MLLLAREFPPGGARFEPMAGAAGLLDAIRATGAWDVAIATGNWECSAKFKLASAALWQDGVPMATADDGTDKPAIITCAAERARDAGGGHAYRRVVYIGDSARDVDAAATLQIGFLGVGRGPGVIALMDAGALTIFRDFADRDVFLASLREFER
jgi:phosphoglycolate phosphatase-like HAD superfamily hydrolase